VKTCNKCRQSLPKDHFHKRTYKSGKIGLQSMCKACSRVTRRKNYRPHTAIRLQLNLTQAELDHLLAPGVCAVCGSNKRLCIDHCHCTEKPRGLLCHKCNTALGLLDDNIQRILKLSQYLAQSRPLE